MLAPTSTNTVPVAFSSTVTVTVAVSPSTTSTESAVMFVVSFSTVMSFVATPTSYLLFPEYTATTVWFPAVNTPKGISTVPPYTINAAASLPSTRTITFPVASDGNSTTALAVSPTLTSGTVTLTLESTGSGISLTLMDTLLLALMYLSSPG